MPAMPAVDRPHQGPDYAAVKQRQQATWASGDFSVVAARIAYQAEQLCETAELQAGWRVLDVATGSGNAALAAARRGCEKVGVDYVPALLDRGRITNSQRPNWQECVDRGGESRWRVGRRDCRRLPRNGHHPKVTLPYQIPTEYR